MNAGNRGRQERLLEEPWHGNLIAGRRMSP